MSLLRAIVFLTLGWAALLVEGALAFMLPGPRTFLAAPELSLFVVLYLGLVGKGGAPALCAVSLAIGYLRDLFVGAPRGVEALAFCVAALLARAMHGRVFLDRFGQRAAIAAAVSLAHAALVVLLGGGEAPFAASLRPLPALLIGAVVVGPFALGALRRIDQRLAPDTRSLDLSGAR